MHVSTECTLAQCQNESCKEIVKTIHKGWSMTKGHGDYSYSENKNSAFLYGVSKLCYDILSALVGKKVLYSDSLRAGLSGDLVPVADEIFRTRLIWVWGRTNSLYMATGSLSRGIGVKRPGRGVGHPPSSSAEVRVRVELYPYFPSRISWHALGCALPFIISTT